MQFHRRTLLATLALLPFVPMAHAADDAYPSKPIRLVVPLGAGSAFDTAARYFAEELGKVLGQQVYVENKPGADTAIGVREVLNAPSDGYTLLALSGSTVSITPFINKEVGYDPKEIRPFVGFLRNSALLVVPVNSKYKSLQQVVAALRQRPESVSLGNYGQIYRFGSRRFETEANVRFNHIPYKAPTQVITEIGGGTLDMAVLETSATLPLLKSGKLRALAITSAQRSQAAPEVPTVAESGWPDFTIEAWSSYAVSNKTPPSIVAKLEQAALKVANSPAAHKWILERNAEPMPLTADQMGLLIAKETAAFAPFVKEMRQ
jgi:tripartite-type tricarboxylate transporter receptor subunit TctC